MDSDNSFIIHGFKGSFCKTTNFSQYYNSTSGDFLYPTVPVMLIKRQAGNNFNVSCNSQCYSN